jgi:hypothetical protein
MYCHNCGKRVDDAARFCAACGTALATQPARSQPTERLVQIQVPAVQLSMTELSAAATSLKRRGSWRPITSGGGLLMVVGFFLPWVSAACDPRALGLSAAQASNLPVFRFSGYDLAIGPKVQTVFGTQQIAATPALWVALVAGIAILGIALFIRNRKLAGIAALAAALVSLIPLLNSWQSWDSQRNALTRISPEVGLWVSLLGIAGAAVGGILGLARAPDE